MNTSIKQVNSSANEDGEPAHGPGDLEDIPESDFEGYATEGVEEADSEEDADV